MTNTRIAGQSFDARQATQVAQLARVWDYARHIRALARQATRNEPARARQQAPDARRPAVTRTTPSRATLLPSV